jgi:hypothetical protein
VKLARAPARVSQKTRAARKKTTSPAAKGTHIRFEDSDNDKFVIKHPARPVAPKASTAAKRRHVRFDDSDSELEDFVIRYPAPPVAKRAYKSATWADSDEEIPGEFDDFIDDSEDPRKDMPYVIPRDLLKHIRTWGN